MGRYLWASLMRYNTYWHQCEEVARKKKVKKTAID
jgi:hypothetical protein